MVTDMNKPSMLEQASMIAIETTKLSKGRGSKKASKFVNEDGIESIEAPVKTKKKVKAVMPTPAELTGYNYSDGRDVFDVPFINEPMWYRVLVRKGSESTISESLLKSVEKGGPWAGRVEDAFYPKLVSFRFGGKRAADKRLTIKTKPMIQGVVFVKMKMDPDLADDMEGINGVKGFAKNEFGLVVPLNEVEAEEIAVFQQQAAPTIDEEMSRLQVGEYVSVVAGQHEGKYGIIEGTRDDFIKVRLRSEYKDSIVNIDAHNLRHLQEPPEVNYKSMTPKQAVEALLVKEPDSAMLKFLRREGLLKEILNPEVKLRREEMEQRQRDSAAGNGGADDRRRPKREMLSGRDGGRSQTSIAVNRNKPVVSKTRVDRPVSDDQSQFVNTDDTGVDDQSKPWKKVGVAQSNPDAQTRKWPNPQSSLSVDSFGPMAASGPQGSAADASDFDSFLEKMLNEADGNQAAVVTGSDMDDFESFIERMLSEADTEQSSKRPVNKSVKSAAPISNSATTKKGKKDIYKDSSPAVGNFNNKDEGFSFDWLDDTGDDRSIDRTLDELLKTPPPPMRNEQSLLNKPLTSLEDFFAEDSSMNDPLPERNTASRDKYLTDDMAAKPISAMRGRPDRVSASLSIRPERPQYSSKDIEGSSSPVATSDDGKKLVSDNNDSLGSSKRPNRSYDSKEANKNTRSKGATIPEIAAFDSFEEYLNALVASNSPNSGAYYDSNNSGGNKVSNINRRSGPASSSKTTNEAQQTTSALTPDNPEAMPQKTSAGAVSRSYDESKDLVASSATINSSSGVDATSKARVGADYVALSKLSVKELKAQCKERKLPMTGLKADLIAKLLSS